MGLRDKLDAELAADYVEFSLRDLANRLCIDMEEEPEIAHLVLSKQFDFLFCDVLTIVWGRGDDRKSEIIERAKYTIQVLEIALQQWGQRGGFQFELACLRQLNSALRIKPESKEPGRSELSEYVKEEVFNPLLAETARLKSWAEDHCSSDYYIGLHITNRNPTTIQRVPWFSKGIRNAATKYRSVTVELTASEAVVFERLFKETTVGLNLDALVAQTGDSRDNLRQITTRLRRKFHPLDVTISSATGRRNYRLQEL